MKGNNILARTIYQLRPTLIYRNNLLFDVLRDTKAYPKSRIALEYKSGVPSTGLISFFSEMTPS